MITVSISINGVVLFCRSAQNKKEIKYGRHKYVTDTGEIIYHKRTDGAVKLACKLLETITDEFNQREEDTYGQ